MNPYITLGYSRVQLMNMASLIRDPDTLATIQEAIDALTLARVDSPFGLCGPADIER